MSKTAKMIIDKDFQISKVDERIYGSFHRASRTCRV